MLRGGLAKDHPHPTLEGWPRIQGDPHQAKQDPSPTGLQPWGPDPPWGGLGSAIAPPPALLSISLPVIRTSPLLSSLPLPVPSSPHSFLL